ncbi:MAG: hypothetical protein R2758_15935 [Bacteroidales bacterium]
MVNVDGKEMALATSYDDDGNLTSLGNSDSSGKEQGFWQYFHRNGELKAEGRLTDGQKDGKWRYFTSDGLLESVGKLFRQRAQW